MRNESRLKAAAIAQHEAALSIEAALDHEIGTLRQSATTFSRTTATAATSSVEQVMDELVIPPQTPHLTEPTPAAVANPAPDPYSDLEHEVLQKKHKG